MRNVERQASMRYGTVTSESGGWPRGTSSENVSAIPEEEELITFTGGFSSILRLTSSREWVSAWTLLTGS